LYIVYNLSYQEDREPRDRIETSVLVRENEILKEYVICSDTKDLYPCGATSIVASLNRLDWANSEVIDGEDSTFADYVLDYYLIETSKRGVEWSPEESIYPVLIVEAEGVEYYDPKYDHSLNRSIISAVEDLGVLEIMPAVIQKPSSSAVIMYRITQAGYLLLFLLLPFVTFGIIVCFVYRVVYSVLNFIITGRTKIGD